MMDNDVHYMKVLESGLNKRIAARVRDLRIRKGLALDGLANKSGVSRSMISLVERGESSATAVVLEKLAAGLGVTLASLFNPPETPIKDGPVARRKEQVEWKDPGSGYVRRNVSPPGVVQPMQITEVCFPPSGRVAFEIGGRDIRVYQQVWVLEGSIEITVGSEGHRLREGDCLAMELNQPTVFYNPTRKVARYAVVVVSETPPRR